MCGVYSPANVADPPDLSIYPRDEMVTWPPPFNVYWNPAQICRHAIVLYHGNESNGGQEVVENTIRSRLAEAQGNDNEHHGTHD